MNTIVPILVAFISAIVVLIGYANERRKDRENRLQQTRLEIHQKLIANLTKMTELGQIVDKDPKARALVGPDSISEWYAYVEEAHPEFWKNMFDRMEIQSLIAVYGSDASIKAIAEFWNHSLKRAQDPSLPPPDLAEMILSLRKSLFEETEVSKADILSLISK